MLLGQPFRLPRRGQLNILTLREQGRYERIFGIVPSHNTLPDRSMIASLHTRKKFRLAGADSFDQSAFLSARIYAGMGQ